MRPREPFSCVLRGRSRQETSQHRGERCEAGEQAPDRSRGGETVKIAPVAEVKAKFSAYLKASEKGPIVVTRNGKAVALLLSVSDEDDVERVVLANSPRFQAILEVARQQIRGGEGIPAAQVSGES